MIDVPPLADKVALVTGAANGIGLAIATLLSERGASVVLADIDAEATEAATSTLPRPGLAVRCDVSASPDADSAVGAALARFGRLDIVVNNAGINRDRMLHKLTDEDWSAVIGVDLTGVFHVTRAAARHMRDTGRGGAIVNIASIAAKAGNLGQANYAAAKAGVVGLTKTTARELARFGIRANAVQPGLIETRMTRSIPADVLAERIADIPLGRPGQPEEVARAVAFLASDEASYITGVVLDVAGGRWM